MSQTFPQTILYKQHFDVFLFLRNHNSLELFQTPLIPTAHLSVSFAEEENNCRFLYTEILKKIGQQITKIYSQKCHMERTASAFFTVRPYATQARPPGNTTIEPEMSVQQISSNSGTNLRGKYWDGTITRTSLSEFIAGTESQVARSN